MADLATAAGPILVTVDGDDAPTVDPNTGAMEIPQEDGSVVVNLGDHRKKKSDEQGFFANLVDKLSAEQLGKISNELIDQIEADDRSRQGSLDLAAKGLDLLGLKLTEPRSSVADSSASVEGMSTVYNPLLLEAVLKGWANAQAELLPASGPVKVTDDGDETTAEDDLAEALERDMNHYLTVTASEYYPDTSHMLLWGTYFKGSGFKKVYRCPMRNRPVSESVDARDLIVSDTTKDLRSCARITHEIMMRPSVMKRMMYIGAYADVTLTQPTPQANIVESKIAGMQGTLAQSTRPEDQPYTVWETQCELDLDEFAPPGYKGEGIPLPFFVTLDKDSRKILALRRDWNEDDKQCQRRRLYVRFPYVPGPGFYGTGMLSILGGIASAMTAATREALDAGMFASFPGGLIAKMAARQNTSNYRVAPGEFATVDTGQMRIQDVVMPMPYKDVTPGLMALMDKLTAQAKELAGSAEAPTAEGIQNVPVGTILAQIEQSTKVMAAAHKGMHQAQSEEFGMIVDLFRDHPEDFWRLNKITPADFWNEQKLQQALANHNLVPVSDPNVPSHMHRVMKAVALLQLGVHPKTGPYLDGKEIAQRCLHAMREDPTGLLVDPPPNQAAPDPKMLEAFAKIQKAQADAQLAQGKLSMMPQEGQLETAKLQTQRDIAATDLMKEQIIHQADQVEAAHRMALDRADHAHGVIKTVADAAQAARDHSLAQAQHQADTVQAARQHGLDFAQAAHEAQMREKEHELAVKEANKPQPKPTPKGKK